mmetsp:Transcript_13222/g.31351  ORF Transcript_13222/g.31351 Transcript_13222/m.31351 type:complete len:118 (+) Transcript_13222:175-528(+)
MGTGPQGRRRRITAKKKQYKKAVRTRVRAKDVDQIQDEIKKIEEDHGGVAPALPVDDDLPGRGQFYCLSCARYFINDDVLQYHYRTKQHKKRLKAVMDKPYTHAEAEAGAGMAPTAK